MGINFLDGLDVTLNLGTSAEAGVVLQVVEGVGNVVRAERLAITPGDAFPAS